MKISIPVARVLVSAGLLAVASLAGGAVEPFAPPALVPQTIDGMTYLNGGIGKAEETAMRHMAAKYPLRITFSERHNGEFLADVPVDIVDMHGKLVLELSNAGPMLFVQLPPGRYEVNAAFEGSKQSRRVDLTGKGGKNLYFHWTGLPRS